MIAGARYVHTNLIAEDWRRLAAFYQELFGCAPVPPERDLRGEALEAGTGIRGARLKGVHLRLPGCGEGGPTLEIFGYNRLETRSETAVNRPGFGHIAFCVDDVKAAREAVLRAGGSAVGEVVSVQVGPGPVAGRAAARSRDGGRRVTWCYVTDPEGNVIELQAWSG